MVDVPVERFDLHKQPQQPLGTFTYMGRQRFSSLLQEIPVPQVDVHEKWRQDDNRAIGGVAAVQSPSAPLFFPPIRDDIVKRSPTTFLYGTIGWGKVRNRH